MSRELRAVGAGLGLWDVVWGDFGAGAEQCLGSCGRFEQVWGPGTSFGASSVRSGAMSRERRAV